MEVNFSVNKANELPKRDIDLEEMHIIGQVLEGNVLYFKLRGPPFTQTQWIDTRELFVREFFPNNNLWVEDVQKLGNREVKIIPKKDRYFCYEDVICRLQDFVQHMKESEDDHIAKSNGDVKFHNFTIVIGDIKGALPYRTEELNEKPKKTKKMRPEPKKPKRARKPTVRYTQRQAKKLASENRRLRSQLKKVDKRLEKTIKNATAARELIALYLGKGE